MADDALSEPTAEAGTSSGAEPVSSPTEGTWVVERPPPGLARGQYAWPDWGIAVLGALLVAIGLAYMFFKVRALRRK